MVIAIQLLRQIGTEIEDDSRRGTAAKPARGIPTVEGKARTSRRKSKSSSRRSMISI